MEVPCPTCNKPVAWSPSQRWRPFCSARCRLIDLGEWAAGNRCIPDEENRPDDREGSEPEDA